MLTEAEERDTHISLIHSPVKLVFTYELTLQNLDNHSMCKNVQKYVY
jgi:hypothetical protein